MTNEIQEYVKYRNDLSLSFADFNPKEKDLAMMWFSSLRGNGVNRITISYEEIIKKGKFGNISGKRLFNTIENTGEKLTNMIAKFARTYDDGKRSSAKFTLFPTWIHEEKRKELTLSLNPDYVEFFNDFTGGNWTSFELLEYICLKSKYSKEVYIELKKWKTVGHYRITLENLIEKLGIPESYEPKKIEQKIIKKLRKELEGPFKGLTIKQETRTNHGKGRSSISAYVFDFKPQITEGLSPDEIESRAIKKSGGKPSGLRCPACGRRLMEKVINGNNCWCHYDFKTGDCNKIYSSASDIHEAWKQKRQEEENNQELTEEQKENKRKLDEMISGMFGATESQ